MTKPPYNIDPAFRKLPSLTIANRLWLLRGLSLLVACSRLLFRWPRWVSVKKHFIPGRDGNRIKIIEIAPRSLSAEAPAIVYYHGGGFFMSYGGAHLKQAQAYAEVLQLRVFFVAYRLSTRQPFPAPLEDCVSAFSWLHDNAAGLRVDRDRIAVMGDSAGGCLAAATAQRVFDDNARRQSARKIRAQFLIYPVLDSDCKTESATQFSDTPMWNSRNNEVMWQVYLRGSSHSSPEGVPPPYASPTRRVELGGLPPAYIESAEYDPLRDEARNYADALTAAGVEVRQAMIDGAVHGYDFFDCEISRRAKAERLSVMRALLCD